MLLCRFGPVMACRSSVHESRAGRYLAGSRALACLWHARLSHLLSALVSLALLRVHIIDGRIRVSCCVVFGVVDGRALLMYGDGATRVHRVRIA